MCPVTMPSDFLDGRECCKELWHMACFTLCPHTASILKTLELFVLAVLVLSGNFQPENFYCFLLLLFLQYIFLLWLSVFVPVNTSGVLSLNWRGSVISTSYLCRLWDCKAWCLSALSLVASISTRQAAHREASASTTCPVHRRRTGRLLASQRTPKLQKAN